MLQRLGISLIDDLVFGEIENIGAILILGDGGTGKSILCKQFAYQGLIRGEHCIYVAIDESPDEIIESMKKFNWNLEAHLKERRFKILSVAPAELSNINALNLKLAEAFSKTGGTVPARVIIDSLTALCSTVDRPTVIIDFIRLLGRKVKNFGSLCFYTLNRQGFDTRLIELIKDVSDGVIELKLEEEERHLKHYLRIFKMKGVNHSRKWIPYTIDQYQGLRFYVPRVLLIGPPGAGKTTIARQLTGNKPKPEFRVSLGELELEVILSEGGQSITKHMVSKDISGIIVVADSADPYTLPEAIGLLNDLHNLRIPTILLANKQDLEDAITPQNIRDEFGVSEKIQIIGTTAIRGHGLKEALKSLLKLVIKIPV
ncbi:TPA: AAA family ATPase [Candidatus Bathyarchaeota archaeon]|nr:AAA family ATPase [Candidatus Bathyarchaeota archaeon]